MNKSAKPNKSTQDVDQLLLPGQSIALLQELHILTREGKLNQDSRRKLKQVIHLYGFIEKLLQTIQAQRGSDAAFTMADHGAGKSYLGFIVYDLYFKAKAQGHIFGIESRKELVDASIQLAKKLKFDRMHFVNQSVAQSQNNPNLPHTIDLVTALHACDSATDDAIAFALQKNAQCMALVPCCQAEVASALRQNKVLSQNQTALSELWRRPLHTREFGSQLTNVLRCLYLESKGYTVTVTELVGWEHSMKNELIIAQLGAAKAVQSASKQRLAQLLDETGLTQALAHRFA